MRTLLLIVGGLIAIIVYAYGFQVTQVDLAELGSETRRESLTRILRALARPDFIEYDQEEFVVETPIFVPCPPGGAPAAETGDGSSPYMVVEPTCAAPKAEIVVEGFNFAPNTEGPLNFIPPSGVSLQLAKIETDGSGYFRLPVTLRDRESEDAQLLRAVTRRNVGAPHLSQNGRDTIDKIIETVFMAPVGNYARNATGHSHQLFRRTQLDANGNESPAERSAVHYCRAHWRGDWRVAGGRAFQPQPEFVGKFGG